MTRQSATVPTNASPRGCRLHRPCHADEPSGARNRAAQAAVIRRSKGVVTVSAAHPCRAPTQGFGGARVGLWVLMGTLFVVAPESARSQDSFGVNGFGCGWSPFEAAALPSMLAAFERRAGNEVDEHGMELLRAAFRSLTTWASECDRTAARQAVVSLRQARQRAMSSPALQAALGVALARGVEIQPPGAEGHNYRPAYQLSNAESEARRLLSRAIELWPLARLGEEISALALATRDRRTLEVAANALRILCDSLPADPSVWLATAEVALARGNALEAAHAAGRAADLGEPSGVRALALTHFRLNQDPAEGGDLYLVGLAIADEAALYRYHEDIAPLLLAVEEADWSQLAASERKAWLRRKWEWRASTAGRTTAERIAIHFDRLERAVREFLRTAHRGARPAEALIVDSLHLRLPYSDRGLILIRHGDPDDIVRSARSRTGVAAEAWIYYNLNEGRTVFEFRKSAGWGDYLLSAPAACDPFEYMYGEGGLRGEQRYLRHEPPVAGWREDFERSVLDYGLALAAADPVAGITAMRCYTVVQKGSLQDDLPWIRLSDAARRMDARRQAADALVTENAVPRFERAIQAASSVYAFRGGHDSVDVAAFVLLPAEQVTPQKLGEALAYPLRMTLAIEDLANEQVQRLDTVLAFSTPRELTKGEYLRTAVQMRVRPMSSATIRITLRNAERTQEGQMMVGRKSIPRFPTTDLAISDLVIGEPGPASWRRGGIAISPLPGHGVAANGMFQLFYEVYGLEKNDIVRTRLTIAPSVDPGLLSQLKVLFGETRVVEVTFEEAARLDADGIMRTQRTVTTSMDPGRYTLHLALGVVERGQKATNQTGLLLLDQGERGVR